MTIAKAFKTLLAFLIFLIFSSNASALSTACGFYADGGYWPFYPRLVADHTLEYLDYVQGTHIRTVTTETSPGYSVYQEIDDVYLVEGLVRHHAAGELDIEYSYYSDGYIGQYIGEFVTTGAQDTCGFGPVTFKAPKLEVFTIVPSTVTVGGQVTITWDISHVLPSGACAWNDGPLVTSGQLTFNASMTDGRDYVISCMNDWGIDGGIRTLVVEPDCPAVPAGIESMTFPLTEGTDTTHPSDIGSYRRNGPSSISTSAYCDGSVWRLKVIASQVPDRIDINLSNMGNAQIDNEAINAANCAVLDSMKTDLESKAASTTSTFGGWYDYWAAYAHENIHRNRLHDAANDQFDITKLAIETLSIPLSSASNQAAAHMQLVSGSTNYPLIELDFHSAITNAFPFTGGHSNSSEFIAAQQNAKSITLI